MKSWSIGLFGFVVMGGLSGCAEEKIPEKFVVEDPPNTSSLWKQYREARQTGAEPELADFSCAGYHCGEKPIPSNDWKVFDVTRAGAVFDQRVDRSA